MTLICFPLVKIGRVEVYTLSVFTWHTSLNGISANEKFVMNEKIFNPGITCLPSENIAEGLDF